jgi:hypothetical protein
MEIKKAARKEFTTGSEDFETAERNYSKFGLSNLLKSVI